MSNKLQEFYNASYPILRKVDNSINIEIITSLRANSLYIATTYYSKYYEDNGKYIKTIDKVFFASSVRSLRKQLKDFYLNYDEFWINKTKCIAFNI